MPLPGREKVRAVPFKNVQGGERIFFKKCNRGGLWTIEKCHRGAKKLIKKCRWGTICLDLQIQKWVVIKESKSAFWLLQIQKWVVIRGLQDPLYVSVESGLHCTGLICLRLLSCAGHCADLIPTPGTIFCYLDLTCSALECKKQQSLHVKQVDVCFGRHLNSNKWAEYRKSMKIQSENSLCNDIASYYHTTCHPHCLGRRLNWTGPPLMFAPSFPHSTSSTILRQAAAQTWKH